MPRLGSAAVPDDRPLPVAAVATVPSWMWGGNPAQFFCEAGLRCRAVPGASERWRLQTDELYRHVPPSLIAVDHILGPGAPRPRLDLLTSNTASSFLPDLGPDEETAAALAEFRRHAERAPDPVTTMASWVYETTVAPSDQLAAVVASVHERLMAVGMEDRPEDHPFLDAGVHLFRRGPELMHRVKLTSVLLQVEHDPRLRTGDIDHLQKRLAADELVFSASQGLSDGVVVGDAYLGPLLGSLSPHVWAFSAHRALGAIIYTLGQPLVGALGRPTELLHLLPSQSATTSTRLPVLRPGAAAEALNWWTSKLNAMFGVLTDPAIFTNPAGDYRPAQHLQALLTIEQLFRRVSSIQTAHRDSNARRVLMFTVLDTLERLTGRSIDVLSCLGIARARLERVSASMSSSAATILLPAAERAVTALEGLQEGFYLQRQLGTDRIEVPGRKGKVRSFDREDAVAQYVKVLRNATHGHGSKYAAQVELTEALLAHHNGVIPHDLALLGYLYLLDVLVHPRELAIHLHYSGRPLTSQGPTPDTATRASPQA